MFVVGLGPGSPGLLTPDAAAALEAAEIVVGYHGYLDLIAERIDGKTIVGRELGQEVERARTALQLAEQGQTVALVSSGDAGVYGMGGVAWELAAERKEFTEIVMVPGVTAACSAAALLGAPLAHDWACISLSDLLTPWNVILDRVRSAAKSDFVLVFYNPKSRTRIHQLATVANEVLAFRPPHTPVGLVENAYRPQEKVEVVTLRDLADGTANVSMFTTVVVGSSRTFVARDKMVTPRIYAAKTSVAENRDRRLESDEPRNATGERIMAESFAIIDREMGPIPSDPGERAVIRRAIHASADFEFLNSFRFSPTAIASALSALREGATIITDVEMLRAGVRRDLAARIHVEVLCGLNDAGVASLAEERGVTRSAAGIRVAAERAGDKAIVAIGNAPTALEETLKLIEEGSWRPSCVVGIPVGFVGVLEAKRRLCEFTGVPWITSLGRKGGTPVTAAVVNALLELASGPESGARP